MAKAEKIKLPEKYDLVVGDNFELFYKGIFNAIDPLRFDFELSFDEGNYGHSYRRKFEWTPTERDIGDHKLYITVRDDDGCEIDSSSVILRVVPIPTSPRTEKVVLCIGDSLTRNGVWCAEAYRRLTAKDGSPVGYGLKNIRFIGDKVLDGAGYVGYGGWQFNSYNTEYKNGKNYNIYGNFDKTDADQHSLYKDEAGNVWKLESISEGEIKIIMEAGAPRTLPSFGRLVHESGGENSEDIVYSSSAETAGNPLWNSETSRVDFSKFTEDHGAEKIDFCYVLLGWNATNLDECRFKSHAREFLDNLLSAYPDCKITLMGLQVPSRDGMGQNYGVAWKYYEKLQAVWNINKWYVEISKEDKYSSSVEYMNLAGQFDTEYSMPTKEVAVNNRLSETEIRQCNGVHPAQSGYLQIADAVLRNFASRLAEDL